MEVSGLPGNRRAVHRLPSRVPDDWFRPLGAGAQEELVRWRLETGTIRPDGRGGDPVETVRSRPEPGAGQLPEKGADPARAGRPDDQGGDQGGRGSEGWGS